MRQIIRQLARQPGFTVTCILLLSIGIGVNTAMFSLVESVLLRPLPYREPGKLYFARNANSKRAQPKAHFSAIEYVRFRDHLKLARSVAGSFLYTATMTRQAEPARVTMSLVTPEYFSTLGVIPAHGRDFVPEEGTPGKNQVVILSDEFWRARFVADPSILGKKLILDGEPHLVVGILPPLQGDVASREVYAPLAMSKDYLEAPESRFISLILRLRDGVTPRQAESEMASVAASLVAENPEAHGGWKAELTPLHTEYTGETQQPLILLMAAVWLVMLVVCANLANLFLIRANVRTREMAVRAALGAGRWQLIRRALAESMVLAFAGAAGGLLLGYGLSRLLVKWNNSRIPRLDDAGLSPQVALYAVALAIAASLFFGFAPAWAVLRTNLATSLRSEARGSSVDRSRRIGRSILVVAEVTLSTVLLFAAGLLTRTLLQIGKVDLGYRPQGVITMRTTLPDAQYGTHVAKAGYVQKAADALKSVPGVVDAGVATALPMMQTRWMANVRIPGSAVTGGEPRTVTYNAISPTYLQTVGVPLLRGRGFTERDNAESPSVVLINEAFQKRYFPNEDPVGRGMKVRVSKFDKEPQIVGVIGNYRHLSPDEQPEPAIFEPHAQQPWPFLAFAVRTQGDPTAIADSLRRALFTVDPELPVDRVLTLGDLMDRVLWQRRLAMTLLLVFACLAALLAAVGLYGVLSLATAQRLREMGIRMALGATRGDLMTLVLTQGAALAATGLAAGLMLSPYIGKKLESMLYGVNPFDPWTIASVAVVVLAVSLAASWLPALRAASIDPASALRSD